MSTNFMADLYSAVIFAHYKFYHPRLLHCLITLSHCRCLYEIINSVCFFIDFITIYQYKLNSLILSSLRSLRYSYWMLKLLKFQLYQPSLPPTVLIMTLSNKDITASMINTFVKFIKLFFETVQRSRLLTLFLNTFLTKYGFQFAWWAYIHFPINWLHRKYPQ